YCMSPDNAADSLVKPDFIDTIGDEFNIVWKITVEPESAWKTEFSGTAHSTVSVRGVEEKLLVVVDLAGI
ncbi:MAG: DNA topoisomerase VI subunit B, partial [Methanomicrobium sp.]|nr:DNA topoisomerase VI subunit B [Methanomicrobium sp.]